jgi:serine/threonine-protein phosphatase 2B catalytic subunit
VSGKEHAFGGDTLANHSEDIKDSITSFDVARISDIENERLPPDLIDASEVEGMEEFASPVNSPRSSADLTGVYGSPFGGPSTTPTSPALPETPGRASPIDYPATPHSGTPGSPGTPGSFRKGHGRNSSLGTTMTSPSTRRRSLESTVSLIREAIEKDDKHMEDLAESMATGASLGERWRFFFHADFCQAAETPSSPGLKR